MDIKFSIIIITLNEEKNIPIILDNLIKQTYKNFEVIIVDSNSSDNTEKKAKEFEKYFNEFTFIKMSKRGVSLGRNTGGKKAKYDNLLFFDADTTFKNNFIEEFVKYLKKYPNLGGGTFSFSIKSKNLIYSICNILMNIGNYITQFFSPTSTGACLYAKKSVFLKVKGFDENMNIGEDCDFSNKIYKNGYKFKMIPISFFNNYRRFELEGPFRLMWKYLMANIYRMFFGKKNKYDYKFGHYK